METVALRTFVSSTFLDMSGERDAMLQRTFPELRTRCLRVGLDFREVELRWGIPRDEVESGRLIASCLAAIDEAVPFFIAVLGERYGQRITHIPEDARQRWPWLNHCEGRSITEIEIRHAALHGPRPGFHSFFYFKVTRSPVSVESDVIRLQREIISAGFEPRYYSDVEDLDLLLHSDVWAVVMKIAKPEIQESALAYVDWHRAVVAGWQPVLPDVELRRVAPAFDRGAGNAVAVYCEDHVERSATLAAAVRGQQDSSKTVAYFALATELASNPSVMINSLLAASRQCLGIAAPSPEPPPELVEVLSGWKPTQLYIDQGLPAGQMLLEILQGSAGHRATYVFDAIDALHLRGKRSDLLPQANSLPPGIRLVVGIGSAASLAEAQAKGYDLLFLDPLDDSSIERYIRTYLARYGKRLSDNAIRLILKNEHSRQRLFLRTLLDELRHVEGHHVLDARVEDLATVPGLESLMRRVIGRVVATFDVVAPGATVAALKVFASSRFGAEEGDLVRCCQEGAPRDGVLLWNAIRHGFGEHLIESMCAARFDDSAGARPASVFRFATAAFTSAAHAWLSLSESELKQLYVQRAAGLTTDTDNESRCDRAWYLWAAGKWERLERLLLNNEYVVDLWEFERASALRYWKELEAATGCRLADKYKAKLLRAHDGEPVPAEIIQLMTAAGQGAIADEIAAARRVDAGPRHRRFSWMPVVAMAPDIASRPTDDRTEAYLLRERMERAKEMNNPVAILASTIAMARQHLRMGKVAEATPMLDEAFALAERERAILEWEQDHSFRLIAYLVRARSLHFSLLGKHRNAAKTMRDLIRLEDELREELPRSV